ncbi:MAG: glycosyltransferase family 39 protein [Planctomycetes bacterium]|nr:glycosyltransferase family 39 protein [Planctomycetota bacterium]
MSRTFGPLTILIALAVGTHVFVVAAVRHHTGFIDTFAYQSLDSTEYYQIAQNVAARGIFSQATEPPYEPDTWRTPGYPLFLALIMKFGGDSETAVVIVQQVLGVMNVWLVFLVARFYMSERRAGVAAVIVLLEPYHLYYSLWLLTTTLFVTVLLLTWYAYELAIRRGSAWRYGVLGVLCGSLVLVRPLAILVPMVVLVGLFAFRARPESEHQRRTVSRVIRWCRMGTYALAFTAVVMSWMARNKIVAGHFALSDQGGVVLAYFKAGEVELWRQGRAADRYIETSLNPALANEPHTVWDEIDRRLRDRLSDLPPELLTELSWRNLAQGNKTTADSFAVSAALTDVGLSMMGSSPLATAACCVIRCGLILTFPLDQVLRPPTGSVNRRMRRLLQSSPYVGLLLLVVISMIRRIRWNSRGDDRESSDGENRRGRLGLVQGVLVPVYFPLACTLALLAATTPQLDPRFRVPMIPFLAFLAILPPKVRSKETNTSPPEA